jgi:hypothetical protein
MKYVASKDVKIVIADVKLIYKATSKESSKGA